MSLYQKIQEKLKTIECLNSLQVLRKEQGAVFVLTALLLPLLIGMLGFAYDAGNLYMHKGRLQHVVDAASLAGARAFVEGEVEKTNVFKDSGTTIGAVEKKEIRNHAKSAAKSAAVKYGTLDMANLNNNNYTGIYSLIEDKSHQQYFRVEMTEKVPLYFIKILTKNAVQDVKAAANSTIPKLSTASTTNPVNPVTASVQSLFMVKSDFTVEGTGFYNADSTQHMHPTWQGAFDGDLNFTSPGATFTLGNNVDAYDSSLLTKAFNSKAKALLEAVQQLTVLEGKHVTEIAENELFLNFTDKLKQNPDYYVNNGFTAAGNEFIDSMKNKLSQGNGYRKAYNYFFEKLRNTPFYYSSFTHIDYDMDSFGSAVIDLFQEKLAASRNVAPSQIPEYLEDKAKWNAALNNITEEQVTIAYNTALAQYQEKVNATPSDLYNLLLPYHNRAEGWDISIDVWNDYVTAGSPGGIPNYQEFKNLLTGNWNNDAQGVTQRLIDWNPGYWVWQNIKNYYFGGSLVEPSMDDIRASLLKQATGGLDHEPIPDEYKPASSDTYYAQYNGNKHSWTASEISNNLNSREHSYFCYQGSFDNDFTLTIDEAGFFTDNGIDADDPFYLFISTDIRSEIKIEQNADMNRPLIICYMGNNHPQFHVEVNGYTFRGVIYTPTTNSFVSDAHLNMNGHGKNGKFEGTWLSDTIYLKQANTQFEYVDYNLEGSLEAAWPTIQPEVPVQPDEPDDPIDNQNLIKVVKLVKDLKDVILIEQIE